MDFFHMYTDSVNVEARRWFAKWEALIQWNMKSGTSYDSPYKQDGINPNDIQNQLNSMNNIGFTFNSTNFGFNEAICVVQVAHSMQPMFLWLEIYTHEREMLCTLCDSVETDRRASAEVNGIQLNVFVSFSHNIMIV